MFLGTQPPMTPAMANFIKMMAAQGRTGPASQPQPVPPNAPMLAPKPMAHQAVKVGKPAVPLGGPTPNMGMLPPLFNPNAFSGNYQ